MCATVCLAIGATDSNTARVSTHHRRATLEYEIDDVGQNCFVCERPGERLGR
jgi:hypothetical protein